MKRIFATVIAMVVAFASPALSLDLENLSDTERAALHAEIRAYLLENPEVIMEAVAVLEKREADQQSSVDKALVEENSADLFNDPNSWVGGNPEGDITMVEFIDYRCGYCRKAHDEVTQLLKQDGNIRFIVKDFPILGEASTTSARFAIAVHQLSGDDAYHAAGEALIRLKGAPTEPALQRLANTLGVDPVAVKTKMYSPDVDAVIAANHALGQRMKINGTPTFVIGNQMLRGYMPLEGMMGMVADLRKK